MGNRDAEVDYVVCRECQSPCYIFEMRDGKVVEAFCEVCGNEDPALFNLGEIEDENA